MVGKTRLALAPMQNHWWQGVLYVTERGLTTSPIPFDGRVAPTRPEGACYDATMREWILPYEVVRSSSDPDLVLMEFLQSTYETAANLAKWPRSSLERPAGWTPPPSARL